MLPSSLPTSSPALNTVDVRAAVAGMAFEAGWCPGAAWGNCAYRMQLLLTPELALQRCWRDTDSLFSGIRDWQAQVA